MELQRTLALIIACAAAFLAPCALCLRMEFDSGDTMDAWIAMPVVS